MKNSPIITGIEITKFDYTVENVAVSDQYSVPVFTPGANGDSSAIVLQIHTDQGIFQKGIQINPSLDDRNFNRC